MTKYDKHIGAGVECVITGFHPTVPTLQKNYSPETGGRWILRPSYIMDRYQVIASFSSLDCFV